MKIKNISIEKGERRGNIFWPIFLALIFGAIGALAMLTFAKNYLVADLYDSPINSETDLSRDNLRQANLIIENAKKIIIGQENKVNETINSAQNSLVGVFKKKEEMASKAATTAKENKFNLTDYYKLDEELGEGLVVTSDGWVLTTDFAKNTTENLIMKNYVVITKNKDIYTIDNIVKTGIDSYLFVHLAEAKDLPVRNFASRLSLSGSQSLVALNWRGESYLTSIVDKKEKIPAVRDSDKIIGSIVLSDNLGDYLDNAFVFGLKGDVVGFFDKKSGLISMDSFQSLIKGLLEKKEKKQPSLGLSYVNLEDFAIKKPGYEKGALIYAEGKLPAVKDGSAAKAALLQEGDVISFIDNTEIDATHDLADVIQTYSAGDEINIIYRRDGKENAIKIKLGELK